MAKDTIDAIITEIIHDEGDSVTTNDPTDPGGRTQFGISERSNPEAWLDGKITEPEAREIYRRKYVLYPKFNLIPSSHAKIQAQIIDFGVHSGQYTAIMKLQGILKQTEDGVLGPKTMAALIATDPKTINNMLVEARIRMIARVVQRQPIQLSKLYGFIDRAYSFFIF